MFGSGNLGLGGAARSPIFLLTFSLLNSGGGNTTPPSRSVLSSSAVQAAFQTLQTDLSNDVTAGSKPTHASVGQLKDDLKSIRNGKLTGDAATTAIQNDETAILTSMGLTSSQVSQVLSDVEGVQSAIQSASGLGSGSATDAGTTTASATNDGTSTATTDGTTAPGMPVTGSAVQSALQTLQSDLKSALPGNPQPTDASIGQVTDDLDSIRTGTLTGSQAVTTIQTDTASVLSSLGLTADQVTKIQSDQSALAAAVQDSMSEAPDSMSSSSSSSSPNGLAGVNATMQSVSAYLIGLPGLGFSAPFDLGGQGAGGFGGQAPGGLGFQGPGGIGMPAPGGFGGQAPGGLGLQGPGGMGMQGPSGFSNQGSGNFGGQRRGSIGDRVLRGTGN